MMNLPGTLTHDLAADAVLAFRADMRLAAARDGAARWPYFSAHARTCLREFPASMLSPLYREIVAVDVLLDLMRRLRR